MNRFRKALLLLSFFFPVAGFAVGDSIGISPFHSWKTLETKHFRITFSESNESTAKLTARYLEQAHTLLSEVLRWTPRQKTQVTLIDSTDSANGFASAALRVGMVLYLSPPENWSAIGTFENWLRMLVIHEYTHFLNLDPTTGAWEALRVLYGDVVRPNSLLPLWMLEGLAVFMETRFSQTGRGRSSYWNMILRAAVKDRVLHQSSFISLDQINGPNPKFPAGQTPYLFGYELFFHLYETAAQKHRTYDGETELHEPEDLFGVGSYRSGGRVPFFINGNISNLTGKTWTQHWDDWLEKTYRLYQAQLDTLRKSPVSSPEWLSPPSLSPIGSQISPDGKLLVYSIRSNTQATGGLYLQDLTETQSNARALPFQFSSPSFSFTHDSQFLVGSRLRRQSRYSRWSDLAIIDVVQGKRQWLSEGLRAKDPDVFWDKDLKHHWVTFIQTEQSTNHLMIGRLIQSEGTWRLEEVKRLWSPPFLSRLSSPRFSPSGDQITFSYQEHDTPGERLMQFHRGRMNTRSITSPQESHHRFPTYSPEGELFYVSDQTGVDNVYSSSKRVTHMETGIWLPSIRNRTAYGSVLTSQGWRLAKISLQPQPSTPQIEKPAPPTYEWEAPEQIETPVTDYSVFPSLFPRQWAPFLSYDAHKALYFGGQIAGFDTLDFHRYAALAAYDNKARHVDWRVLYSNRQLGPTLTLDVYESTRRRVWDNVTSLIAYRRKRALDLSASLPFPNVFDSGGTLTPRLSLRGEREYFFLPLEQKESTGKTPFVPSLIAGVQYTQTPVSPRSIAPESGRSTSLAIRPTWRAPSFGNAPRQPSWKFQASHAEYLHLGRRFVLIPSLGAAWVTRPSSFEDVNVSLDRPEYFFVGKDWDRTRHNTDQLTLRGYPGRTFFARRAAVASLDFRFPVVEILRGLGTQPFFFRDLYGVTFAEVGVLAPHIRGDENLTLPSIGAGLHLRTHIFHFVPSTFFLEWHYGFRRFRGGGIDWRAGIGLASIAI